MKQFLIGVNHTTTLPIALRALKPGRTWTSSNGHVQAWIWGEVALDDYSKELTFTVGSALDSSMTSCPYVRVRLDCSGTGTIEQDPLGLHPLYTGTHGNTTFVSNSQHRVAEAISTLRNAPVPKCLSLSAYLVSCERPIGLKSGYEGILCTPYATRLTTDPIQGIKYIQLPVPWNPDYDVLDGRGVDEAINCFAAEMASNLRLLIRRSKHKIWLPITGGYDSRLVLALAIEGGVLEEVELRTAGHDDHPDVIIAGQIAQRLSLHHTITRPKPIAEALRTRVHRTAGALSLRLGSGAAAHRSLVLSGLMGEAFRSNKRTRSPLQTREQIVACWLGAHAKSGLLHRDAQIEALTEGIEALLSPLEDGIRAETAMDAFYVQHLMRRWISARPEMFEHVALPLYCLQAIQFALQMGWAARKDAVLHQTVVARAGGPLLDVPYATGKEPISVPTLAQMGIDYKSPNTLEPRDVATLRYEKVLRSRRPSQQTVAVSLSEKEEREIGVVQAEYREYVEESSRCAIWDVIDREKVREAVNCMPRLRERARQELDAAITGVLWHSDA